MGKIIASQNQKGGVGKTSVTGNVGAALAGNQGTDLMILLPDVDPQGSLSKWLLPGYDGLGIAQLMRGEAKPEEVVVPIPRNPGLFIIPATDDLYDLEMEFATGTSNVSTAALRDTLYSYARSTFDLTIIDCPPSFSSLTIAALIACDKVLVPLEAGDAHSVEGVPKTLNIIKGLQKKGYDISLYKFLMNKADMRTKTSKEAIATMKAHFPNQLFKTVVSQNAKIKEAVHFNRSVLRHAKTGTGACQYRELAREIITDFDLGGK